MSLKTTKENYKKAKSTFLEIDDIFQDLQSREIEESEFQLDQVLDRLKNFKKYLRNVDAADLAGIYEDKTIRAVLKNLDTMRDANYFWERFFLQAKYGKDLFDPIKLKYIPELNLSEIELKKWGKNNEQISWKFIGVITHPDNIKEYENKIKRMILGTMSRQEFKRIFDVLKYKMITESMKIPTLKEYQNLNEDFFNPFDKDDLESKEKKPKHISDRGGVFKMRKETFNLARVEFTKRPGGEYTILAKTHFAKGEIIEICPTILLKEEAKTIDSLKDIIFEIDSDKNEWALVLGYGSLYKHSEKANIDYAYNRLTKQMYFISKDTIKQGAELTINYGQDYWMERTTFNTFGDEERTDKNQGMPISGKVIPKEEIEESEVQPNAADIKNTDDIRSISSPRNPGNPVISGVAIIGSGQS
jgi:hypothetical protein